MITVNQNELLKINLKTANSAVIKKDVLNLAKWTNDCNIV